MCSRRFSACWGDRQSAKSKRGRREEDGTENVTTICDMSRQFTACSGSRGPSPTASVTTIYGSFATLRQFTKAVVTFSLPSLIDFFRVAPKGATTSLSKCSGPFIQSVKSTLSHLKSCNRDFHPQLGVPEIWVVGASLCQILFRVKMSIAYKDCTSFM